MTRRPHLTLILSYTFSVLTPPNQLSLFGSQFPLPLQAGKAIGLPAHKRKEKLTSNHNWTYDPVSSPLGSSPKWRDCIGDQTTRSHLDLNSIKFLAQTRHLPWNYTHCIGSKVPGAVGMVNVLVPPRLQGFWSQSSGLPMLSLVTSLGRPSCSPLDNNCTYMQATLVWSTSVHIDW